MRRLTSAVCVAAGLFLAVGVAMLGTRASLADSGFSSAQRAEIVTILREALKADPSILRDAIAALQADDAAVKEVAARAAIDHAGAALGGTAGDPEAGNPAGDVTVVEFYDLRCPYCRKMLPVMTELLRNDPKVRLVYKDIPILGAASVLGAHAVLAAQRQGGYGRLRQLLMAGPAGITEDTVKADAARAGLDWERLHRDMADPAIEQRLSANLDLAHALSVDGTPVYIVGRKMLPGAVDLAELQSAIAAARSSPQ